MSDLTSQILMAEMQNYQPQTTDPYGPIARGVASVPVYHPDADPWANIGASFVQSFTAGLFGELSRGRQQQIQQERFQVMLPIAQQYDQMQEQQRLSRLIADETIKAQAQRMGQSTFLQGGAPLFAPQMGQGTFLNGGAPLFSLEGVQNQPTLGFPQQQGQPAQPLALPPGTQSTEPQNPAQMSIAAPQDPQQMSNAALLSTIGQRVESVAGPAVAQKLAPEQLKRAEEVRKSFRQIEELTNNAKPIIEGATTSGNYLAQGLDFAMSQLGPGEARDRRTNLQILNQLGSQYKRMIKNADNITGGQMNTAAELKLIAGDAFSPDSTPEANLYALNLIKQRLPEFALEFEQLTGIPLTTTAEAEPTALPQPAPTQPTAPQAQPVSYAGGVQQNTPRLSPQNEAYLTNTLTRVNQQLREGSADPVEVQNITNEMQAELRSGRQLTAREEEFLALSDSGSVTSAGLTERDLPLPQQQQGGAVASSALVDAIVQVESGGNPNAVGYKPARNGERAQGLMQVLPSTARDVQERYGIEGDFRDPEVNKEIGTAYINEEIGRYGGNLDISLAAYNWGRGNVDKLLTNVGVDPRNPPEGTFEAIQNRLPAETLAYVPKVKAALARRSAGLPEEIPVEEEPPLAESRGLRDIIAESVTDATLKVLDSQILPFNKIGAAVNAGIDTASSGFEGFQDSYKGYRDATDRAIGDINEDIGPEYALAADILSTGLDPINVVGGASTTLKGLIGRAAAEGGTFLGGRSLVDYLAGGEGTYTDVIGDTVKGAGAGALGAGIIGGTMKGLGALAKTQTGQKILFSDSNPFKRLLTSERGAVSFEGLPDEKKLYAQAKNYLTTRFKNVDPDIIESAAQEVAAARAQGVPLNLSDELLSRGSATAETLGKTTAKLNVEAADDVTRFLTSRGDEQAGRVSEYVETLSKKPSTRAIQDFAGAVKSKKASLKDARSKAATPLYELARKDTPTVKMDDLDRVIDTDGGDYIQKAISIVKGKGKEVKNKALAKLPDNHIDVLAKAREYVRDTTLPNLWKENKYTAKVVQSSLDDLTDVMNDQAPLWAAAQDIFRNGSKGLNSISKKQFDVIEALADSNADKLTQRVFALSRDDIDALAGALKAEHMDAIRGMVKAHIADIAELGGDNTRNVDFINKIVGKNFFPQKLRSLLGDEADDVLAMLDRESKVFLGNQRFNNLGSPTAPYLSEIARSADGAVHAAVDIGGNIASGNIPAAIGAGARRIPNLFKQKEMPQQLSRAIAEILFDPATGQDAALDIAKAIRNYRANRNLVDAIVSDAAMTTTRAKTRRE